MHSYAELQSDGVYLIKEKENGDIALVQVMMETNYCIFLLCHGDVEKTYWKKKSDALHEVIEQLSEDKVTEYEELWEDDDELGGSKWYDNDNS